MKNTCKEHAIMALDSGGSIFFFALDYYKRDCRANSQGQMWDHAFRQLCKRQCIAKPQGVWVISNMVFSKKWNNVLSSGFPSIPAIHISTDLRTGLEPIRQRKVETPAGVSGWGNRKETRTKTMAFRLRSQWKKMISNMNRQESSDC